MNVVIIMMTIISIVTTMFMIIILTVATTRIMIRMMIITMTMMILVIMSHGTNGRILTSEGKSFDVEQIYQMFNNSCCSKLKGKPKFFIIQVSR